MADSYRILILGASYGSLLATKLALAGHHTTLVCLPAERDLINAEGIIVRMPVRGRDEPVVVRSAKLGGTVRAAAPDTLDLGAFDLAGLAMQEPQYRAPEVRGLLAGIAAAGLPCMSIMNMPPLAFLRRLPGVDAGSLTPCYTDASVWDAFDPARFTLASPDPQAFRPPDEPVNVLQVSLPTNFKVAAFEDPGATTILRRLQADIESARLSTPDGEVALPVKLKVHDSVYVPLAKWCMLLTGNYRCIGAGEMQSIRDAVHGDLDASRRIYEWVAELCRELGAAPDDQVPFEKYARAAEGLSKPSSAARALAAGAQNIERVDCVVRTLAAQRGRALPALDDVVETVDGWLQRNRAAG